MCLGWISQQMWMTDRFSSSSGGEMCRPLNATSVTCFCGSSTCQCDLEYDAPDVFVCEDCCFFNSFYSKSWASWSLCASHSPNHTFPSNHTISIPHILEQTPADSGGEDCYRLVRSKIQITIHIYTCSPFKVSNNPNFMFEYLEKTNTDTGRSFKQ